MRTGKSLNLKKVVGSALALLGIMVYSANVFAQQQGATNESPNRGAALGNAYAVSDFETVNTTNGNLMLNFQLGSLPAGRGQAGAGISLVYNSKLWDMGNEKAYDWRSQDTFNPYVNKTVIKPNDDGGWKFTSGYSLKVEDRTTLYGGSLPACAYPPPSGGHTPYWEELTYRYKLKVVFPDGGAHELIPYGFQDVKGDRFYRVNMDGRVEDCANIWPSYVDRPIYYSVDGTYMRLETNSSSDWKLFFSDGRKVINSSSGQKIYDKNGNYVTFANGALSDQLGRSVTGGIDSEGNDQIITRGVGGEELVWTVKWKQIFVNKTYQSCVADPHACPEEYWRTDLYQPFSVVSEIVQPEQLGGGSYTFSYNAPNSSPNPQQSYGWGEVSEVELPSGAKIHYNYAMDGQNGPPMIEDTRLIIKNYPNGKTVTYNEEYDGASSPATPEQWGYSTSPTMGSVSSPSGGSTTYFGSTEPESPGIPLPWNSGLALMTIASDGTKTDNIWAQNIPANPSNFFSSAALNPYVKSTLTSIKDAAGNYTLTAIRDFTYDKNGNVTDVKEYDWVPYSSVPRNAQGFVTGLPSGITPKRITKTEFYNDTPEASSTYYNDADMYVLVTGPRLLNLAKSAEVQDGSGNSKSRSEITYDYTTYGPNLPNGGTNTLGGNPTVSKAWDNTKGDLNSPNQQTGSKLDPNNSISTSVTYNSYGMPTVTADARGVETTITYGCIDGQPNCEPNLQNLYSTKVESASNYSSLKRTSASVYDFYTGVVTTATDVDNNVSIVTEYDDFGRPTKVRTAAGTALEFWVQTEYNDVARKIIVRSDLETVGDGKKVAAQFFDQLGRVRLTKMLEDPATQSAVNETDGIKVQTRYKTAHDSTEQYVYQLTSNPYRAARSYEAGNELTMGWTISKSWLVAKKQIVETFSGAALPSPFVTSGENNNSTGVVTTNIDANRTLITDQAEKQRISKTNALGQLTDVWEITGQDSATVAVTFPGQINVAFGYQTGYNYDTLGNLTTVTQGAQTRSFAYSSLSRLLSSANPESGTISYQYDANGNLTQKSQPRSSTVTITTAYVYDALNRIIQRSYSGDTMYSTPTVTYEYDNKPHAKGKLTKISSSVSENQFTSFDILGRVLTSEQVTDQRSYAQSYVFNLSGALIEQTYPSTRKVKNVLNNDGSLSLIESKKTSGSGYWTYANSFSYTPSGAVSGLQLGNGHWESTHFNGRSQPIRIALGTTSGATDLLKLDYSYGTNQNNGNVQSQTVTVPTVGSSPGFAATQNYQYDFVNRLKSAEETISNNPAWKQTFVFDRYGNRRFDTSNNNTTTLEANCPTAVCNPEVSTVNNRLIGATYDSAGNTTVNGSSGQYVYDGENKMVEAKDSAGNLISRYWYDGDGKRVKKYVPGTGEITIFVYDTSGKTVAEYSTQLSQEPQVAYMTSDHLGSPRINTGAGGAVIARHDYHPFGDEISTSHRTPGIGYGTDEIRKKFTGYERDNETGLDFAQARMYSSSQGRFTTPDIITVTPARVVEPQQLNLYAYTKNNPLAFIDPTGMIIDTSNLDEDELNKWQDILDYVNAKDKNGKYLHPELQKEYARLDSDSRTFIIKNHSFGDKSGTGGEFVITKFKGDNDFSEAEINLDLDKVKKLTGPTESKIIPGFNKFEGLFGENGKAQRRAELFGHEAAHAIYALDNLKEMVQWQKEYNANEAAREALPLKNRYPLPEELSQKMTANEARLAKTELYAQQQEQIINGELRASQQYIKKNGK